MLAAVIVAMTISPIPLASFTRETVWPQVMHVHGATTTKETSVFHAWLKKQPSVRDYTHIVTRATSVKVGTTTKELSITAIVLRVREAGLRMGILQLAARLVL